MELPRVSIVIPIFNVTAFFAETLESVLAQNFAPIEIVVIDDGSEEKAAQEIQQICSRYTAVSLYRQENLGQTSARKLGLRHAVGELIIFLDADDLMLPEAIDRFVCALSQHPHAVAVYGRKKLIDQRGKPLQSEAQPNKALIVSGDILPALLKGANLLSCGSVCMRKKYIEQVNLSIDLRQGEDWIMWCRLALLGDVVYVGDTPVLAIRSHGQNISRQTLEEPELMFEMLPKIFDDPDICARVEEADRDRYRFTHTRLLRQFSAQRNREEGRIFRSWWQQILCDMTPAPPKHRRRVLHLFDLRANEVGRTAQALDRFSGNTDEHVVVSTSQNNEGLREFIESRGVTFAGFNLNRGSVFQWLRMILFMRAMRPDAIEVWLPAAKRLSGMLRILFGVPVIANALSEYEEAGGYA